MAETLPDPLITVAMPVYNAGKDLRMAVLSIVGQTYANWELLVIDDGSTDDSLAALGGIRDPRIRVLSDRGNKGRAARLNEAIDLARGRYLARMDQDDVSFPGRFASQVAHLEGHPKVDLVAVRAITISPGNELVGVFPSPLTHAEICSSPWRGFYLPHPTWMGRIEWFRRHRYRIPESYLSDDQELLLRSYRESTFACVDEVQFAYRVRDRIRLGTRLRTRWAVLRLQAASFAESREYGFMLRAVALYLLRICHDAWTCLFRSPAGRRPSRKAMPYAAQWERVRRTLCPDAG
jgi:glycosyltransferase involved in cell wall biosynthesis